MSRQRKVVITVTYNDLGIIVDTKTEELDLSAQPNLQPTCNKLATDTISRRDAIDAIERNAYRHTYIDQIIDIINALPSAQPTLYGYNIEHLELIARVLQKEDLPPERIVEALTDIGRIVAIVKDEFEETLRKAVEQCTI